MKTKIVNKYYIEYNKETDIMIMRPTKYGNPYKISCNGDRNNVIKLHYESLLMMEKSKLLEFLRPLVGKRLVCCCKPLKCHGDNYIKLIKKLKLEEDL